MPLSWSEIRARAVAFTREWRDVASEAAEKQTYWNDFFVVFGKKRRAVAAFEEPVKKLSGSWGRIDLFRPRPASTTAATSLAARRPHRHLANRLRLHVLGPQDLSRP